ncbi:MAG: cystathionine gamma-lyase [Deltaproteobacteria bacterium]|nr:cystathionine gamma-lyase [Deltaproteobacteria bacterium]MBV8451553.1 cystathionine gamma-lyase [Deltaproteobacteria bacterium]
MSSGDLDTVIARTLHRAIGAAKPGDLVVPPIVPAAIYYLPDQPSGPYQYGRWSNPTWDALESALAVLEQAEVVVFPSGMAAISAIFYSQLKNGDRALLPSDAYYTTRVFAERFLAPMGIAIESCATTEFEMSSFDNFRLVFVETPSNPGLDICDLESVIARAKKAGALVIVDNTTMTPIGQRPLDLGADAIVSSDSKAINGHSDTCFGHVASRNSALIANVREWRRLSGAIPGFFEAWMVHRGLESLEVRYERMCDSAIAVATQLSAHPKVRMVKYPGLPSHPTHDLAKKQMRRFGSLIAVCFGTETEAERFINRADFIQAVTSFGGVHTSAERRGRWGDKVPPGFVRLSVGCEPPKVLWEEMKRVLDEL